MSGWLEERAPAKLNLALVVGPLRPDGKHEVATALERLSLADTIAVRTASRTRVTGFAGDSLVRAALEAVRGAAGTGAPRFEARVEKRVPVAAGLGGGSSDAATALRLANRLLGEPLPPQELERLAASLGSDVPFFLREGAQLATGDGTTLEALALPTDYVVLLALPHGASKRSTRAVYEAFDRRGGERGYAGRRAALETALRKVQHVSDLAALPVNDLASSPLAEELRARGALRADVTGAGPVVYGLFRERAEAERAAAALAAGATTWIATPG